MAGFGLFETFFAHYPGYGIILFLCIAICLQVQSEAFHIGALRRRFFDKSFFEKHFPQLRDAYKMGYPDQGTGRFADKLTDEQWLQFNNAQRAHQNYLEQLPTILVLLLISGLGAPRVAVPLAIVFMVGRWLYGKGYRAEGPVGRMTGTKVMYIGVIGLLFTALYTCFTLAGGVKGLTNFSLSYLP